MNGFPVTDSRELQLHAILSCWAFNVFAVSLFLIVILIVITI